MRLRDRLILLKDLGISYSFIASIVELHKTSIAKYVKEEFEFSDENYEKLDELTFNLCAAIGVE